ncbi:hypothetical protein [Teredinibacter purpureus]|uniref:hypothetical protein n=1 Tax=Teredinibacter purpureus TaxID=2731756 RepID=UPI0005F888C7|nr:hypothetical protein [Teredinibacter purpureus]
MEVLLEPAVIVSLIGSLLIAMLSKRLAGLGEFFLGHVSLIPSKAIGRIRVLKWRYRKNLILSARNQHRVTWAIVRTYSFLIFFVLVIVLYLLLITIGPLKGIGNLPGSVQAFIAAPIYIIEVLWLLQKEKAQDLIKVAEKRVTRLSKIVPAKKTASTGRANARLL